MRRLDRIENDSQVPYRCHGSTMTWESCKIITFSAKVCHIHYFTHKLALNVMVVVLSSSVSWLFSRILG